MLVSLQPRGRLRTENECERADDDDFDVLGRVCGVDGPERDAELEAERWG